jgi:ActR/RegA family two-component response regulator
MRRLLLVDDDIGTLDTLGHFFHLDGWNVRTADTGSTALRVSLDFHPDAALIDLNLPDCSGLEVLKSIIDQDPQTACFVITGVGSVQSAIDAMKLGALDYLEKPLACDFVARLLRTIPKVDRFAVQSHDTRVTHHSLIRWATLVVRVIDAPSDLRTVPEWGHFVGVSAGALRNWCRTAHIGSRQSLLFARLLRAVVKGHIHSMPAEDLLNIVDRRTLLKVIRASGGIDGQLPVTVDTFFEHQHIVSAAAVSEVRYLFSGTPYERESPNGVAL